ncbi:hypothetical protein UFOVP276_109 [uncultured Caudovirales phage]|uniref:Uncharacterized protein n=1 Tax=uncultured Caudovirales phage TaxID=2100421 RepID=A0A6J5LPK6_9CAUD|nr:hypothetical protein UFOVP127_3 [uncultured Caudovirales phage]CAB4135153.1 hypothetical protein UFOVP276_109 [uncultured Caudovirales phage]
MALPFPHGKLQGQIGYQAVIDENDIITPGGTGGRFIGFGQIGTTAIANRASWALSTNIDYLYNTFAAKSLTYNQSVKFTSAGVSSYTLSGSVFCGDSTYPGALPTDPEGMRFLFSVVDPLGNSILDVSGNVVGVHSVVNGSNVPVYKQGFVTNPKVLFCTYDESGAVVTATYTIPASTVVRLVYAVESTLESMPVDAITKYALLGIDEVISSKIMFKDGTRTMTGNLNMGSKDIVSAVNINCTNEYCETINGPTTGATLYANNLFTVRPAINTQSVLTVKYTTSPSDQNTLKPLAALQLAGGDEHTSRSSITLQGNPKSAAPGTRVLWNVTDESSPITGRTLMFDPVGASFGPADSASSGMYLGSQVRPWRGLYTSDIRPSFIGAAINLFSGVNVFPITGTSPLLRLVYDQSGLEANAVGTLATIRLESTADSSADIVLKSNPVTGGGTSLEWTVTDGVLGSNTVVFRHGVFGPAAGTAYLQLGTDTDPWTYVFGEAVTAKTSLTVYGHFVMGDSSYGTVEVYNRGAYYTFRPPAPQDFRHMLDFGNPVLFLNAGQSINEDFYLNSDTGAVLAAAGPALGRATVAQLMTGSSSSAKAKISGPIVVQPNNNYVTLRASIAPTSMGSHAGMQHVLGFNTATPGLPQASITVGATGITFFSSDLFGHLYTQTVSVTVPTNKFIDLTIWFTPGFVNMTTSHGELRSFTFTSDQTLAMTPELYIQAGSVGSAYALVDYIEIYSEGHVVRPAWTV